MDIENEREELEIRAGHDRLRRSRAYDLDFDIGFDIDWMKRWNVKREIDDQLRYVNTAQVILWLRYLVGPNRKIRKYKNKNENMRSGNREWKD